MATLTIIITAAPQQEAVAVSGFGSTGVGDALGTGWNAFTDVLHAGALGLAYIAPFLVLTRVAGLLWLLFRRHSLHSSPVPGGVTEPNP